MVSPEFLLNRKEFQKISRRVIHAFNPKREAIPNAAELEKRITKGMRETGNWRAWGFLKGGGHQLAVLRAKEGERAFQVLLGWVKPKVRRIRPKRVKKWTAARAKWLIRRHERTIIRYRHELRKLGVKLKPYSARRIRRLEEEFLEDIGWTGESSEKDYRWKRR